MGPAPSPRAGRRQPLRLSGEELVVFRVGDQHRGGDPFHHVVQVVPGHLGELCEGGLDAVWRGAEYEASLGLTVAHSPASEPSLPLLTTTVSRGAPEASGRNR